MSANPATVTAMVTSPGGGEGAGDPWGVTQTNFEDVIVVLK